jgi:hypothetical protein
MAPPVGGSRKVTSATVRGFGSFPATSLTISRVAGPESRNTAIAARPAPEAMAKIVSVAIGVSFIVPFWHSSLAVQMPRLVVRLAFVFAAAIAESGATSFS